MTPRTRSLCLEARGSQSERCLEIRVRGQRWVLWVLREGLPCAIVLVIVRVRVPIGRRWCLSGLLGGRVVRECERGRGGTKRLFGEA